MSRGRRAPAVMIVVSLAAVVAALGVVAWRQSTTREMLEELGRADRELAVALDELEEVARELVDLESRSWVTEQAWERLGLRAPNENELVITAGAAR